MLVKTRSSTAIAVSILAIAIGVNTAVFSVLNAALLKLLPVRNPNELMMLTDPNASMVLGGMLSGERSLLGYEEFTRLRDRSRTLSGLCASQLSLRRWPVRIAGGPQEQARGRLVSENYFSAFGVYAAIGRLFMQSDATAVDENLSISDVDRALSGSDRYLRRFFLQRRSAKKRVRHPYGTGAERSRITGMIVKETGLMIMAGLIAGVIAAAAAARLLAVQLYSINSAGPRWSLAR
jgi:hypothetical protein